jgi:hypothetical protein
MKVFLKHLYFKNPHRKLSQGFKSSEVGGRDNPSSKGAGYWFGDRTLSSKTP